MNETWHTIISGRVQGVGYRAWTVSTASKLKLTGWVRNRNDGTVEAVFHGATDQLGRMIAACRKGPMLARVDDIQTKVIKDDPEEKTFEQKPTV